MNVSMVSFAGKREIEYYAKAQGQLSEDDKKIKQLAEDVWEIKPTPAGDGDYCSVDEANKVGEFERALTNQGKSLFAYRVAVDAFRAPVYQMHDGNVNSTTIRDIAAHLAYSVPEVTKADVLNDLVV